MVEAVEEDHHIEVPLGEWERLGGSLDETCRRSRWLRAAGTLKCDCRGVKAHGTRSCRGESSHKQALTTADIKDVAIAYVH